MNQNKNRRQIVILGAGFAGIRACLDLAKLYAGTKIILVSHNSYHLYHAALYEVATTSPKENGALELKKTVAIPIVDIIGPYRNITFKQAWVNNIDLDRRIVQTDDGDLAYDGLVVALGSRCDYYDIPGLKENALAFKNFEDAIKIRNHLKAAKESTIVFCGGGPTGVELAGEVANFLKSLGVSHPSIYLIEAATQLLPGFPKAAAEAAEARLTGLGVKVKTGSVISQVLPERVVLGRESLAAKVIINTLGVKSQNVPFNKIVSRDKKERLMVSSRLNLDSAPEVFVVGDNACYMDPSTGKPLPATAVAALHQAKFASVALARVLRGQAVPVYRAPKKQSFAVPIGGKFAVVVWRDKIIAGLMGYMIRRLVDLKYFISILPLRRAMSLWFKGSIVFMKND